MGRGRGNRSRQYQEYSGYSSQSEERELTPEEKLDECIEDLGGFGPFQLFAYFTVSTGINSVGFWFYQLGYLLQEPKYDCSLNLSKIGSMPEGPEELAALQRDICTSENICAADSRISQWSINWDHEASLHNWHEKFDLKCWPKAQIGLVCSMFWLGWCATLLWMPRLGDLYGRRYLIVVNNFISLALYLAVLYAPDIYFLAGVLFTWGFFNSTRTNVGFLYMIELMPKKNQNLIGTVWNCFEGLINLFATFWFMYVTTHWFGFVSIGLAFQIFTCIAVFYLPEPPVYLLKRGLYDELREALELIADWNGSKLDWETYDGFQAGDAIQTKKGARRPDKAENVMQITGLPGGTEENRLRVWVAKHLPSELNGVIYHFAVQENGTTAFISFITHAAMLQAKSKLHKVRFFDGREIEVSTHDITRSDLVATALNYPVSDDSGVPPAGFYLSKPDVQVNLVIMVAVWLITVFDFYLIGFLVNTFDQIFYSSIASGVSEFVSQAFGGYIYEKLGVQTSLCASYAVAAIGGFLMLTYGLHHQEESIFPVLVLIMKFGIASAFNITYVCHKGCFPTLFSTSSLGYCTFICRFFTAFTPMVAQVSQHVSMMLFAVSSSLGALIVLNIRAINEEDYEYDAAKYAQELREGRKSKSD